MALVPFCRLRLKESDANGWEALDQGLSFDEAADSQ
jgi:hypothetical protein